MNIKRYAAFAAAAVTAAVCSVTAYGAENGSEVNISIDTAKDRKAISPYIYGVNTELKREEVACKSVRTGGNRCTAYNWETNASNAGSDREHISDDYFRQGVPQEIRDKPACAALDLAAVCKEKNAYPLMSLQMAGYASADMNGEVTEAEKAPSDRWVRVEPAKGAEFSLEPDTGDGVVYMDELVNYLVKTLGDSQNGGIRGYSLDNEPSLWNLTHSRVHPEHTSCGELIEKSVALAKAVKAVDGGAEIFGPALFGYGAFTDFAGAPDWQEIKAANPEYRWFVDYYLDEMRKAEEENGSRLLDVLDVHYYTEAKGECGERSCRHYNKEGCVSARLNAPRSLWDGSYKEKSWIIDTGAEFFPLLPNIKSSIDKYYPGTKLAVTEYDFGAPGDISGGIAEADALGIFAQNEVYFASLFAYDADYQMAAINLYTNYDGNGNGFGDTLVSCESSDIERCYAYAAINGENSDTVTLVLSNKSFDSKTTANITLDSEYDNAHLYGMNNMAARVFDMGGSEKGVVTVSGNTVTYEMEPETVSLLVITRESKAEFAESEGESSETAGETKSSKLKYALIGAGTAAAAVIAAVVAFTRKKSTER
ncbi:MAG: glycoside hydrolase family 44 protein [Ruminococcus sp.]|nr:glycoside hydrolase family 44 protein [Ruminococcus sp.]